MKLTTESSQRKTVVRVDMDILTEEACKAEIQISGCDQTCLFHVEDFNFLRLCFGSRCILLKSFVKKITIMQKIYQFFYQLILCVPIIIYLIYSNNDVLIAFEIVEILISYVCVDDLYRRKLYGRFLIKLSSSLSKTILF